jgi:hypothetical protein
VVERVGWSGGREGGHVTITMADGSFSVLVLVRVLALVLALSSTNKPNAGVLVLCVLHCI